MTNKIKNVHISTIKPTDTVLHNGELKTVCKKDLTYGFCGICLFGDSYKLGTKLVKRKN